jgi:aspartyl/asparaginyl-tRNA synthetase
MGGKIRKQQVKVMNYTKIAAIFADGEQLSGQTVTVGGWARTIRDMKTFGFIELNDGSCFKNLQVVMSAEELANYKANYADENAKRIIDAFAAAAKVTLPAAKK